MADDGVSTAFTYELENVFRMFSFASSRLGVNGFPEEEHRTEGRREETGKNFESYPRGNALLLLLAPVLSLWHCAAV